MNINSTVQNGLLIDQGRAWARVATGKHSGEAIELPRLGRMGFENAVASPFPQEKTIVALLDDSSISTAPTVTNSAPSEVFFYIGRKQRNGHPIEEAGLTNGKFYGFAQSWSRDSRSPKRAMTLGWARLPAVTSMKVDLISRNWAMLPGSHCRGNRGPGH